MPDIKTATSSPRCFATRLRADRSPAVRIPSVACWQISAARWAEYLARKRIPWPRLPSGALALDDATFKDMAKALRVSSAYLSALEHGRRGKPTFALLQKIIAYFNVIWDDAEELQRLAEMSDPKITIDTAGMSPEATELANRLARDIGRLEPEDLSLLSNEVARRLK